MATDLDGLLTTIEGLRGDRKAAFTALTSAAATCMHVVLDQAEPELRARLEEAGAAGFRVMIWHEHRVDLLVGGQFLTVAELPAEMLASARLQQ